MLNTEHDPQGLTSHDSIPSSAPSVLYHTTTTERVGSETYPLEFPARLREEELAEIRQLSQYASNNKAAPDNNMFFEALHNPLSSKGD